MEYRNATALRRWLLVDAIASAAMGALMVGGAGLLSGLLELPEPLLRYAGLALLPFAALVAAVAARRRPPRAAVWAIVAVNALWAIGSVAMLLGGLVTPNAAGSGIVVLQAAAVAVFAEMQAMAVRRAPLRAA